MIFSVLGKCVSRYVNVISTTGNGTAITTNQGTEEYFEYNAFVTCQWQVTAPAGCVVAVTFNTFAGGPFRVYGTWTTPCSGNQVCTTNTANALFTAYAMPTIRTQYFLTANPILLMFTSDSSFTNHGVTATITFQGVPCPANSAGASVAAGCLCNDGFFGTVVATSAAPFYSGNCVGMFMLHFTPFFVELLFSFQSSERD